MTRIGLYVSHPNDCLSCSVLTFNLENLRYSLASCLYGFDTAIDSTVTPCSTSRACGPLQDALEDGNFDPNNETAYGYCGAYYAAMMGSTAMCRDCLRNGGSETFLSNCELSQNR